MPQQQHAEGIAFLQQYLQNIEREFQPDEDDGYEIRFILRHMIDALSLTRRPNGEEIAHFAVGRTLATVLLGQLTEEHGDELKGWQKFDAPSNPAQWLAKILVSAIAVFDGEIRKHSKLDGAYRIREQIARSFATEVQA